jgi:type VI secretion system protein VasG
MSGISRETLFGKLNPIGYQSVESATVFCKMRGNPYVELVHWLAQLVQSPGTDIEAILRHYQIESSTLARDITTALDRLPRGSTSIIDFSDHIEDSIKNGWLYGTLMFGQAQVRTGYLVIGMLQSKHLYNAVVGVSRQFDRIKVEHLSENFAQVCGGTKEAVLGAQDGSGLAAGVGGEPGTDSGAMAPAAMGKQEALKKFCVDLTERARAGKIDPVNGRDEEIRQIVDILMRRRQNNPILTGEAGVGKTAVVEGFAQRLARGDVPPQLAEVSLLSLDLGLLQAGASMKGEFEQRLRQVIDEVQASPKPIILFIDEVHTLVGAGCERSARPPGPNTRSTSRKTRR